MVVVGKVNRRLSCMDLRQAGFPRNFFFSHGHTGPRNLEFCKKMEFI